MMWREKVEGGFEGLRRKMVEGQIASRGIDAENVLEAFREIPRHLFVRPARASRAYEDNPLDIGHGQTISQPYMVALMTDELELTGSEKVMEIGTGSGYQTAILSRLAREVYTIDIIEKFIDGTRILLDSLGLSNISYFAGDGTLGIPEFSPYDRIIVTAGAPDVPASLIEQLSDGGIMVIPVGTMSYQSLFKIRKQGKKTEKTNICGCRFVPLKGKEGW